MILRINLNNCNLYKGNIMKCVRYDKLSNLTIVASESYKHDVALIGLCNNRYMTLEDYVAKRHMVFGNKPEKVNDLFVEHKSLKKANMEEFEGMILKLKRNK